jgi:hypothetical protein
VTGCRTAVLRGLSRRRHEVVRLRLGLPIPEVIFSVVENLAGLGAVVVDGTAITRDDGCVIEKL